MTRSATRKKQKKNIKNKIGPPSKKELTDKAREIIRKDKSENKMSSFNKVSAMLTKEGFTGAQGEKGKVHATDARKKFNREIFKGGQSKQIPAMMKEGGEVTSEFRMGGKVDISNFKGQF